MVVRGRFVLMLCAVMMTIFAGSAAARDYRITTDGQEYFFDLNLSKVAVSFVPSVSSAERSAFLAALPAVGLPAIERDEAPLNMTIVRLKPGADESAVLATLAILEASPLVDWAAPVLMYDQLEHVPTPRLYVQFSFGLSPGSVQSTLARHGLTVIKRCDDWAPGVVYVTRGKGTGVESLDLANALMSEPGVSWAVPDFNRIESLYTNDTFYSSQWYLYQASRHDIHAPEAWAVTTGDTTVVISICDVGVQIAHPDLAAHIVIGYDASDGDNDPTPATTYADDGHGTCTAGIAAAVTNNSLGVAGVGYNCRLMGTRMGYISGGGGIQTNDTWIINCINYSRDHAKVQSDSWGGGTPSSAVNTALQNAKNAGLTILFSSGNGNTSVSWPATQSSVIAVGATNESDHRCSPSDWGGGQGSNYGSQLDVVAPGNNQYTTDDSRTGAGFDPNSAYISDFAGTSGACPVAAGVCALIISRNHSLIPDSVQAVLQRTANDLVGTPGEDTPGWDQYMGWGRVNAGAAVNAVGGSIAVTSPNGSETWYTAEIHNITWTSSGFSGNVKIELNRAYSGGTWETIIASTGNAGTYPWTVTSPVSAALARIRVSSVVTPTITDVSDANFTIAAPFVTVSSPNGLETWYTGESHPVIWTSGGFAGNVKIEINRTYSTGAWETIIASTGNTGSYAWTVTGPASTQARIRVSSVNTPATNDVSDNNFTVAVPSITVTAPNGGEFWSIGSVQSLLWTSAGVSGNVNIELNRTYPSGTWQMLAANSTNDGFESWTVTGPTTLQARLRVTSVAAPSVSDVSDNNFTIAGPPPVLLHDALADFAPGTGTVTAIAYSTQLLSVTSVTMYYRPAGGTTFTSLALTTTGHPNEYAASLAALTVGSYEYYVQATDNVSQVTRVPSGAPATLYTFTVGGLCASELSYDDGSAEMFNYPGADSVDIQFAVKFGPVATPFALCGARFAASRSLPDSIHTPVRVAVYLADGPGGLPGTLVTSAPKGSVGDVIGGLPLGTNWARVIFRDGSGNPPVINASQFYIAVSNIQHAQIEAFGRDTNGTNNHHSYVFDPCQNQWFSEDAVDSLVTHPGNRLIRAQGFGLLPPTVTINRVGSDIKLFWSSTGAPLYSVYNSANPSGPYGFLAATTDSSLTVSAADSLSTLKQFYQVQSATP